MNIDIDYNEIDNLDSAVQIDDRILKLSEEMQRLLKKRK